MLYVKWLEWIGYGHPVRWQKKCPRIYSFHTIQHWESARVCQAPAICSWIKLLPDPRFHPASLSFSPEQRLLSMWTRKATEKTLRNTWAISFLERLAAQGIPDDAAQWMNCSWQSPWQISDLHSHEWVILKSFSPLSRRALLNTLVYFSIIHGF